MGVVPEQYECDHPGCNAVRRDVNNWFVVKVEEDQAVHIYEWECARRRNLLKRNKHFCGHSHAFQYASQALAKKPAVVQEDQP